MSLTPSTTAGSLVEAPAIGPSTSRTEVRLELAPKLSASPWRGPPKTEQLDRPLEVPEEARTNEGRTSGQTGTRKAVVTLGSRSGMYYKTLNIHVYEIFIFKMKYYTTF